MIKLLAHIDVYLNDGINKIIDESIKTFDLKTFSIFEISIEEKNRIGKESENIQKNNLNKSVLEISLVTKDKIIKCNGVWTKVQSLGSANKFSCRARMKP